MKILFWGAAGFIGTNLTIKLAENKDNQITLVDRSKSYFSNIEKFNFSNVEIKESSLGVVMDVSNLEGQDAVYHLVSTNVPTIVTSALDAKSYAYNFATREMMGHDRGETLSLLDGLLSEKLDLVTIQLSENTSDLSMFESDFEELIRYVQKSTPDAQILVIGVFWDKEQKDEMKRKACEETGVEFISLDEI